MSISIEAADSESALSSYPKLHPDKMSYLEVRIYRYSDNLCNYNSSTGVIDSFEVMVGADVMSDLRAFSFDILSNGWCRFFGEGNMVFYPPHRIYEVKVVKIMSWEQHIQEMKGRP